MNKKKIMAIASRGGHWVQLNRLSAVWVDQDIVFVTNDKSLQYAVQGAPFATVIDANFSQKGRLIILAAQTLWHVLKHRPDVIISTGAAPGFFAILWGRMLGVKTVWVDSIANSEELSMAGKKVGRFADVWLTQWAELEVDSGPIFRGDIF